LILHKCFGNGRQNDSNRGPESAAAAVQQEFNLPARGCQYDASPSVTAVETRNNYTDEVKGATVGNSTVSVQWPDGEPGSVKIPAKYNAKTELKKEVKSGSNEINLELTSS
jgi:hypothetical protein